MTPEAPSSQGHFSAMLTTALTKNAMTTKQLADTIGVSYEHARRLVNNESSPSPLLAEKIATTLGADVDEMKQAAQRDKIQRKLGDELFTEVAGTSSARVEKMAPLIDSLLPEQVPHATAMLSGLVTAARQQQTGVAAMAKLEASRKQKHQHVTQVKRLPTGRKFRADEDEEVTR